jgi:tRNA threonylcarbamoyladenosine dehydratase
MTVKDFDKIQNSHILIIGLGGVGSWVAESLARSGVGQLTIVDPDSVCISNINRQIIACNSTIGKSKINVMKSRILDINPNCKVTGIEDYFCEDTRDEVFKIKYDFAFDGIDRLKNKILFIFSCLEKNIPFLISGGAGGKIDSSLIRVSDIGESYRDRLLFSIRKKLRQNFSYKKGKNKMGIPCIFSPEETRYPDNDGNITNSKQGLGIKKLDCHGSIGSFCSTTGVFGLMAAGYIIKKIISKDS